MSKVDVFAAIAHPTRRRILTILTEGDDSSLSSLSSRFDESRQAVRKHLEILNQADLIRFERFGREQRCVLQARQLELAHHWITQFESHWDEKLLSLKQFVEQHTEPSQESKLMVKKKTNKKKTITKKGASQPKQSRSKTSRKKTFKKRTAKKTTKTVAEVSPVKGKSVTWYISTLNDWQAEAVSKLDKIVMATVPQSTSSIKWAQAVYESGGPFCYIRASKKHVTIGFWRGAELNDPKGLLEGSGNKMQHIKIRSLKSIPITAIKSMIRQAVKLNKANGDPSR